MKAILIAALVYVASAASASSGAGHDIALQMVGAGKEGLELSARLSQEGDLIQRPITWSVFSAAGEPVFIGQDDMARVAAAPGDYRVDLEYGAVHLSQNLSLVAGTRLVVSFVLDAGAIRILPNIPEIGLPVTLPRASVYALDGANKGKLVARSFQPGEILNLPNGRYRIESTFENSNVSASTQITVKSGGLSAVEFDHKAGLARLAYVGASGAGVVWQLTDAKGKSLDQIEGLAADVVLRSGTYVATAKTGGETLRAKFIIAAGQSRDIILGN